VTFAAYSRKGAQSRARIALSEVLRIPLLRTRVNKGKGKGRARRTLALALPTHYLPSVAHLWKSSPIFSMEVTGCASNSKLA
jgi:hypothetical protein